VQESALRFLHKYQAILMEDREVRDSLSSLEERLRSWVQKYSVDDVAALQSVSQQECKSSYRPAGRILYPGRPDKAAGPLSIVEEETTIHSVVGNSR
jgi:hypothetical protein